MRKLVASLFLLTTPTVIHAHEPADQTETAEAASVVEQLHHAVGKWNVTTTFLRDDGSVAGALDGTYEFEWVVPGKVVSGVTTIPDINQTAAIMFYHRPATSEIEMVSVGPDGQLWVMTGADTSETRETPVVTNPDGSTIKLRFTRFNVTPDSFESKMERSTDGGETWVKGNHQIFTRAEQADVS